MKQMNGLEHKQQNNYSNKHDTKNYLAWNEQKQDEIVRNIGILIDEQCLSNQLFVRSIKQNREAIEVVRVLKQDVVGYIVIGDSLELVQIQSVAGKLKQYRNTFQEQEIQSFLQLANKQKDGQVRLLAVLESLKVNLSTSLKALETNEINKSGNQLVWFHQVKLKQKISKLNMKKISLC